jgi:hypothetical protein
MIVFVGDVHAMWEPFDSQILAEIPMKHPVIQVGDLGCHPSQAPTFCRDFDFVEGNHDYIPGLVAGTMAHPTGPIAVPLADGTTKLLGTGAIIRPPSILDADGRWRGRARYRPRGTIEVIDGRRVAFLGGAESIIDRAWRREYVDWWKEEAVRHEDVMRLLTYDGPKIDILVTHMPPDPMVQAVWGYASTYSQRAVDAAWRHLGRPTLVCGHNHPDTTVEWRDPDGVGGSIYCLPILGVIAL